MTKRKGRTSIKNNYEYLSFLSNYIKMKISFVAKYWRITILELGKVEGSITQRSGQLTGAV